MLSLKSAPIGVFDSGVGGISVLSEMMRILPNEKFIYYGDTLHAPYGTKTKDEVLCCVNDVVHHLLDEQVKALVIACNTATAVAASELRERYSLPIIGMEPALKPAHQMRRNGSILVMATPMTLSLPKFRHLMDQYGEGAIKLPCPGLMELVETMNFPAAKKYLKSLFKPFDFSKVDVVVLGCTHYVFLKSMIQAMLPDHVIITDGNQGTARQLYRVLEAHDLMSPNKQGECQFETSGDEKRYIPIMQALLELASNTENSENMIVD